MFQEGDIITFGFATGGAGYGDPLDRVPELVIEDIRNQLISDWSAEKVYKVVYDKDTLKLDRQKTERARQNERESRLKQGKPYDEFEKDWLGKKVDDSILKFYGCWPNGEVICPIMRM
jgi:acetophenone carboxylase